MGREAGRHLADSYAEMDYRRARTTLRNLRTLMTMFDSIEGTKNLVLFQQTIRLRPGIQYPLISRVSDVMHEVQQLAQAANERDVRVYPVAAGGLGAGVDNAMTMLATETGGRWVENTNDLGVAFKRVAEDSSCFYRVGFRTRSRFRGKADTVVVKIAGDGKYRVRHRRTVYDGTHEERNTDRIQAAMLHPRGATELPVLVSATSLLHHGAGARVRVQIGLPLDELLALRSTDPDRKGSNAWLQIGGSVIPVESQEEDGLGGVWSKVDRRRESFHFSQSAALQLPESAEGSRRLVLLTRELDVPPGRYRIVAVVQDQLVGTVGAGVAFLEIPKLPPAMTDIQLAVRSGNALLPTEKGDRRDRAEKGGKDSRITAAKATLPANLVPRDDAVLRKGEPAELVFGLCIPADETSGGGSFATWRLHRSLSCDGGRTPAVLSARRVPAPGLEDRCVVVVEPLAAGSLAPGHCRFEVTLEAPGGRYESRSLSFQVTEEAGGDDA